MLAKSRTESESSRMKFETSSRTNSGIAPAPLTPSGIRLFM